LRYGITLPAPCQSPFFIQSSFGLVLVLWRAPGM